MGFFEKQSLSQDKVEATRNLPLFALIKRSKRVFTRILHVEEKVACAARIRSQRLRRAPVLRTDPALHRDTKELHGNQTPVTKKNGKARKFNSAQNRSRERQAKSKFQLGWANLSNAVLTPPMCYVLASRSSYNIQHIFAFLILTNGY
ncbi:hypothetical protein CRM22_006916 [Opisthorchis felineus]|uniref:Uncharacterized protein n=1 Tax=Opisthorchis felineus TaxID=147828 RepID=A0A4S2LIR1_OPIFE|nr:hypothetical protein CRM22_006916 [Opisthorchis felineus]